MEEQAKLHALACLRRREYSVCELHTKLVRKGIDHDVATAVIKQLAEDNLQSDARFAENYTSFRFGKGFGPLRVRRELESKGISKELALASTSLDEQQMQRAAQKQLQKKFASTCPQDMEQLAKMKRFLYQRGFPDYWLEL